MINPATVNLYLQGNDLKTYISHISGGGWGLFSSQLFLSPEPESSQINGRIWDVLCMSPYSIVFGRYISPKVKVSAHNLILLCIPIVFADRDRVSPYFGRPQAETSYVIKKYEWKESSSGKIPLPAREFVIRGVYLDYKVGEYFTARI